MAVIGEVLGGKYQLVRKIGEGGMGAVYEARNLQIGKQLAVKILIQHDSASEELVGRFQAEARAAAAVGHPGIIDVYDLGWADDGSPYIVMELLLGQSLNELLEERERLSIDFAAYLACQVLSALSAVHQRGIVHRDLKPENIFLIDVGRTFPELKILDFGISKFIESASASTKITKAGTILGTPQYMSPEHAGGMDELDHLVDIYAVGAILFECVTGQQPYTGKTSNEILSKILSEPTPRPGLIWPHVPPSFEAVILKAMHKEREQRYPSADALLVDLLPFAKESAKPQISLPAKLRGRGPLVPPSGTLRGPPVRIPGQPSPEHTDEDDAETELYLSPARVEARPRRWPLVVAACAIAGLGAAFGFLLYLLWQPNEPDQSPSSASSALTEELIGTSTSRGEEPSVAGAEPTDPAFASSDERPPGQRSDAGATVDTSAELARLTIIIRGPDSSAVTVSLDGQQVEGPPFNRAFPLDGRSHHLTVTAPGYHRWREDVVLERDRELEVRMIRRSR